MKKILGQVLMLSLTVGCLIPTVTFAASGPLLEVYNQRPDLQTSFEPSTFRAIEGTGAGFLIDLEDWARQYGWQEHKELAGYAPAVTAVEPNGVVAPVIESLNYIVIDDASGQILAAKQAEKEWPIASITKLVTTKVALDHGLDTGGIGAIEEVDDVGGSRLAVAAGTRFTISDLLYTTLVASANNSANAIARLSGVPRESFIIYMNNFVQSMNLSHTRFTDPTGIDEHNVSTAREIAYIAKAVWQHQDIRRMSGTTRIHVEALNDEDYIRDFNNTNRLLYDSAYDDVYVTAGKTGYLDESGWNLVVRMHPMGESEAKSVIVVIFGAGSRAKSCDDAHVLALWAWQNHNWTTRK
ncbi:MAG: serine hydrolase [Patescibacteria group bacterium]